MSNITKEMLISYLDDALSTAETAEVEQALRTSDDLRQQLKQILGEFDRGEHSVGAIWRRARLTCPDREQLKAYLLFALESDLQDYVQFHLEVIGCPFCQANLTDLQSLQNTGTPETKRRRKKFLDSSIAMLNSGKEKK